jgi:hypothetical protein
VNIIFFNDEKKSSGRVNVFGVWWATWRKNTLTNGSGMDICLGSSTIDDQKLRYYKTISPTNVQRSQDTGSVKIPSLLGSQMISKRHY